MSRWQSEQSQPTANVSLCPCHPPSPPPQVPHGPPPSTSKMPTMTPQASHTPQHIHRAPSVPRGDNPITWHPSAQKRASSPAMHTRYGLPHPLQLVTPPG